MSTRSGRIRASVAEASPPRTRKGGSPSRSPGRARKSSPPAQPSSRKSPSRKSPSRKSPSRKSASKFPARKSPSRTTKEATETAAQKSPGKRPNISTTKSDVTVNLQDFTKLDSYRSIRTRRSEYSVKDIKYDLPSHTQLEKVNGVDSTLDSNYVYGLRNRKSVEEVVPRRSSRLREFDNVPDIRRSPSQSLSSKSLSKSISQSLGTFSDEEHSEDDTLMRKSESLTRKLHTPLRDSVSKLAQVSSRWEFGGRIGSALLMLLLPATVISILLACTKSCSAKTLLDLSAFNNWSAWFSLEALAIILIQNITLALLSLAPIQGTKADRMDDTSTCYFNAFFSSIFTVNLLFTLNYFNLFDSDSLLNNYLRLAVASYIFAVLLSIILYVKSRNMDDSELNPYGNTGYHIYDFCMGREIHPYIKNLNVKIWVSRIANINALILAILIFKHGIHLPANASNITLENYKEFLNKVQLKPTILVFSMMQIVYILNFIMKEYKITSTFFWHSEGLGYLQITASALYPFYFTTISKYIVDSKVTLSTNVLITASIVYMLGFFLMLISNNIKYEFRKNPLHPSLAKLDSMPTFHGKKLLVSSVWGVLRHPNYAGDMLVHCALCVPGVAGAVGAAGGGWAAAAPGALCLPLLLHRARRDHARCRRRYGAAWERYCKRVPSLIIPKIL